MKPRVLLSLAVVAAGCCATAATLPVTPVPAEAAARVRLTVFAEKLDEPLAMAFAPRDPAKRLFIVEKTGAIRMMKKGAPPSLYLSFKSKVSGGSEQGLLGLAFHNDFMKNGKLYVNYTDLSGNTRIVEITVSSPTADEVTIASKKELLFVRQPYSNHNGGHLVMTPEGWLLVGLGDGGSANDPQGNGQNPKALLGKMIRLEGEKTTILASGMRNPWRYALDRKTNDLYIADVGQNKWEEVDVIPLDQLAGKNFGWNVMEGNHCFKAATCDSSKFVPAVAEYDHDAGCSITGGVVYRGSAIPSLAGTYFYSDYCTAFLRSFRWTQDAGAKDHWDWTAALNPKSRLAQISSFGEDEDGEIYVIGLTGTIWKFVPATN